jgi:hypothetical protein
VTSPSGSRTVVRFTTGHSPPCPRCLEDPTPVHGNGWRDWWTGTDADRLRASTATQSSWARSGADVSVSALTSFALAVEIGDRVSSQLVDPDAWPAFVPNTSA